MDVVYATDNNYVRFCGVSMASLLENNKQADLIRFFVLDYMISEENRAKLEDLVNGYSSDCTFRSIAFINISSFEENIKFDFNTSGFSKIVLARLFLGEYLPKDVENILYLDGDTVVCTDLCGLERLDMTDYYVAAVPELYMPPNKKKQSIGFEKEETYYNAGMLWINLKKWRNDGILSRFLDFYREKHGRLLYNDQDIINYCCKGKILTLPAGYNLSPNLPFFPLWFVRSLQPAYSCGSRTEWENMLAKPNIIHYMGDERPWIRGNMNYYRGQFNLYQNMTVWKYEPPVCGKEWYMFFYHLLNLCTMFFPHGRIFFSRIIGINKFALFGKK